MKTKPGQILIITLLVLTIIAIATVGLVSLANRDIQQVSSTQQYEDAYNTAETQLKKILDVYGKPSTVLSTITSEFGTDFNCQLGPSNTYSCNVTSDDFSTASLYTDVKIRDTKDVTDFPIYKDRSFDMNLTGFLGTLNFSWDKNAAIEIEIIYNEGGVIKSVRDVYDNGSPRIYNSLTSDQPYLDPNNATGIHPFNFKDINTLPDATSFSINLTEVLTLQGTPISGTPLTLKITPRMADQYDSILLNVTSSNGSLVNQIREFTAKTYNINGGASTPVANIESKVPLAAQPDSILDSSILLDGTLQNNP